jgi:translation initiation factor IF-3
LGNTKLDLRINHQIKALQVRLIGSDGKQIGVVKLNEAIEKAMKENLDLIEIAPLAKPPVAKIANLGKFIYQENKKLKKQVKKSKPSEVKEVRFSPFIGSADYKTRIERINEFLKDGNKVRAVVKFKGRQMNSKDFGYKLLKNIIQDVAYPIAVDMEPKFLGRHLAMVISPIKKVKPKEAIENPHKKDKIPKGEEI